MYQYERDLTRTVGATEQTWDARWMDGRMEWNQYTPNNFVVQGVMGYNQMHEINGLVHDCSNSGALAMELPHSCAMTSKYCGMM